ncbi:hypothetical protein IAU60_006075 [Kwoniella sp. DSM 27419]
MSTSSTKQRHYAALSSRLRSLQSNLADTESQMELMAEQLKAMARFGVGCGAQFMAVSRLLDVELDQANTAAQGQEAGSGVRPGQTEASA